VEDRRIGAVATAPGQYRRSSSTTSHTAGIEDSRHQATIWKDWFPQSGYHLSTLRAWNGMPEFNPLTVGGIRDLVPVQAAARALHDCRWQKLARESWPCAAHRLASVQSAHKEHCHSRSVYTMASHQTNQPASGVIARRSPSRPPRKRCVRPKMPGTPATPIASPWATPRIRCGGTAVSLSRDASRSVSS